MANNVTLTLECYSQKGEARSSNQDFISIFEWPDGALVSLIDIATGIPINGKAFITQLNTLIPKVIMQAQLNDKDLFISSLKQIVDELKEDFKTGCASFIICYLPFEKDKLWGYTVGDSRLGKLENKYINWLTPIHTAANLFGEPFTEQMKAVPERHLLTRSLNMRKAFNPEYFVIDITDRKSLFIASDGFWAELSPDMQNVFFNDQRFSTEDDCSVIKITNLLGSTRLTCEINSENCSYFDLTARD